MKIKTFQPGDRVVRLGSWMNGARGVLITPHDDNVAWIVDLDDKYVEIHKDEIAERPNWGWAEKFIILEEVYESPLYQTLEEE